MLKKFGFVTKKVVCFAYVCMFGMNLFATEKNVIPIPTTRKITVVVCDGLDWDELLKMNEPIPTLIRQSAIGLLSGASLDLYGRKGVYATLGAGMRATGSNLTSLKALIQQHGKKVRSQGNGNLDLMLGIGANSKIFREEVFFVSVFPEKLPSTLKRLKVKLSSQDCFWLIVPNSSKYGWTTRRLTPILLFGKLVPHGLISSSTTKTKGLVSSVDFAPTLLTQLNIPVPPSMTGRAMFIIPQKDPIPYLNWLDRRSVQPLHDLPSLATVAIVVIVLAIAITILQFFLFQTPYFKTLSLIQRFVVVSGLSIPAMTFIVGQIPHRNQWENALYLVGAITIVGIIATVVGNSLTPRREPSNLHPSFKDAGIVCALSALVGSLGVALYWATPLGHYPTTGWRYFGITNSGIGIVLAGTIFAWHLLSLPTFPTLICCFVITLMVGSSMWGANIGGALTLTIGFAFSWEYLVKPKPSWQYGTLRSGLSLIATIVGLMILEILLPYDRQGHLGQLLHRMEIFGWIALTEMFTRKLSLLWQFTKALPLNFAVLITFACFTFAVPLLVKRFLMFAKLLPASIPIFISTWMGFFLNDSGIEIVAMSLVYVGGISLLALDRKFLIGGEKDENSRH